MAFSSTRSPASFHVSASTLFTNACSRLGLPCAASHCCAIFAQLFQPAGLYRLLMWYPRRVVSVHSGFVGRHSARPPMAASFSISFLWCSSITPPQSGHTMCALLGSFLPSLSLGMMKFGHSSVCMWPHCGHGTKYLRLSLFRYSASIRHTPAMPGVLHLYTLRRANVVVRATASSSGSPSPSTSAGQLLISSAKRYRIGMERNPAALFAPPMSRMPPGNSFSSIVLLLSRLLLSVILAESRGVSCTIGLIRCLLYRLAPSTVGSTSSIGPGAWSTT